MASPQFENDNTSRDRKSLLSNLSFVHRPKLKIRSDAQLWAMSVLTGAVVFLVALLLQWIIYDRLLHEDGLRFVGSAIAGLLSAVLVHGMMLRTRRERLAQVQRLETIALMNHHIRNGLQAIVNWSGSSESAHVIREAVDRIQWVLLEVLPGLEHPGVEHRQTRQ